MFEMSGDYFGKVDKVCHLSCTATVVVASVCSVPMDILNNIKNVRANGFCTSLLRPQIHTPRRASSAR